MRNFSLIILSILPVIFLITGYSWTLNNSHLTLNELLSYFSYSIESIYILSGIVILAILILIIYLFPSRSNSLIFNSSSISPRRLMTFSWWKIIIIVLGFISVNLIIKDIIKKQVQEQRPYVSFLVDNYPASKKIIEKVWIESPTKEINKYFSFLIESYTSKHKIYLTNTQIQQFETASKFSFPSGHSMFAVTIALLFFFFANYVPRHRKNGFNIWTAIFTSYAIIIELSRIILGMHYPHDILASVVISWISLRVGFYILERIYFVRLLLGASIN